MKYTNNRKTKKLPWYSGHDWYNNYSHLDSFLYFADGANFYYQTFECFNKEGVKHCPYKEASPEVKRLADIFYYFDFHEEEIHVISWRLLQMSSIREEYKQEINPLNLLTSTLFNKSKLYKLLSELEEKCPDWYLAHKIVRTAYLNEFKTIGGEDWHCLRAILEYAYRHYRQKDYKPFELENIKEHYNGPKMLERGFQSLIKLVKSHDGNQRYGTSERSYSEENG